MVRKKQRHDIQFPKRIKRILPKRRGYSQAKYAEIQRFHFNGKYRSTSIHHDCLCLQHNLSEQLHACRFNLCRLIVYSGHRKPQCSLKSGFLVENGAKKFHPRGWRRASTGDRAREGEWRARIAWRILSPFSPQRSLGPGYS